MSYAGKTVDEIVSEMWAANQDAQTKLILGVSELSRRAKLAGQPIEPDLPEPPVDPDLPDPDGLGLTPVEADSYQEGWGDTLRHRANDGPNCVLRDSNVTCAARSGLMIDSQNPLDVTIEIDTCVFERGPVHTDWGIRGYGINGTMDGVHFYNLGLWMDDERSVHQDGHGAYFNLKDGPQRSLLAINGLEACALAGQALQLVTRPEEGDVPQRYTVDIDGVDLYNVASQPGRGACGLALYAAAKEGMEYTLGEVRFIGTHGQPTLPGHQHSTRGIIACVPDRVGPDAWIESFSLQHLIIDAERSDRDLLIHEEQRKIHYAHIEGRLRGIYRTHSNLPVLMKCEALLDGWDLIIESCAFDCYVEVSGTMHRVYRNTPFHLSQAMLG